MISDTSPSSLRQNSNNSEEITLKDLFIKVKGLYKYLLSQWKIIIGVSLIGSCLGFFYAYNKKASYMATTTFVLAEADKSSGGILSQYSGLAAMAGIDAVGGGGGIFQGDNILQLYTSRAMIETALLSKVNANELLIDRYIRMKKLRDAWASNFNLRGIKFNSDVTKLNNRLQDSVLGKVVEDIKKNYLSVSKPDKKLSIISVDVKAEDEAFAKDFNNQIVKTVNDFFIQTITKKALQNVAILQHQTDSVKSVLNGAIYQAITVADATPNLNPARQILREPVQRYQFNAEANKAILTQLVQNLELAKIALRKETPLLQIIDFPVYPLFKSKPSKLISAIIGALLLGLIAIIMLFIKKVISSVLNS
jgi:hypothetical protein